MNLYGHKCHLCAHLDGPTHDWEPSVFGGQCPRCLFCQDEGLAAFLMEHATEDWFDPEVRAAVRCFRTGQSHPLLDKLRDECLVIQAETHSDGGDHEAT